MTTQETWNAYAQAAVNFALGDRNDPAVKRALHDAGVMYVRALPGETSEPRESGEAVFPPYGKSKGKPVRGASRSTLEYYRNGCMRSLEDPTKERWHAKERVLLAAIEGELARQG